MMKLKIILFIYLSEMYLYLPVSTLKKTNMEFSLMPMCFLPVMMVDILTLAFLSWV